MDFMREYCQLRHPLNGNCLCAGGFCTAVNDETCVSLHHAFEMGRMDGMKSAGHKTARWKYDDGNEFVETYKCDSCGFTVRINIELFRETLPCFCGGCGALMTETADGKEN